mmetsp:Transcript_97817/g.174238  ORF Transcript_97817/g.174238 Transcript_97817/m.174238 type:complete len:129 (-) Transcript_97817:83-469(-)
MPRVEVIVNKKSVFFEMADEDKFGELMRRLSTEEGIDVERQVILYDLKEFRMPQYEQGKLVIYDGEQRSVNEDQRLEELKIDGSEPLVCGELQDEWLEEVKWGAFGHTLYEADYLNHREFVIFNGKPK